MLVSWVTICSHFFILIIPREAIFLKIFMTLRTPKLHGDEDEHHRRSPLVLCVQGNSTVGLPIRQELIEVRSSFSQIHIDLRT